MMAQRDLAFEDRSATTVDIRRRLWSADPAARSRPGQSSRCCVAGISASFVMCVRRRRPQTVRRQNTADARLDAVVKAPALSGLKARRYRQAMLAVITRRR